MRTRGDGSIISTDEDCGLEGSALVAGLDERPTGSVHIIPRNRSETP